jgi:serine/threonine protein kinase
MHPASASANVPEIGKYHLIAELARGGMGNVYLASLQGPGGFQKLVAIKELKPELCDDDTYVAMFLEEARLAARLHHPNIVQTNEVGSEGGRHYMVMEFLDGRSLHRIGRRFAQQGGFPLGAHLRILVEALRGLEYAHELAGFDGEPLGIVHRDVSPLNVIVTFDGQTKVLDFGIAKCEDSSLETKAGILKGRVAYMAPEQAYGAPVDRRADVYSMGVMIWEAVAGRRLWSGMTDVEILARVLGGGPPALRSVYADAPADLDAICSRAMARRQEDRYPTAAALIDDLERYLASREDAMTMREIGSLLDRSFREERQQTNLVIEDTLLRVQGGARSGVMPAMRRTRRTDGDAAPSSGDGSALLALRTSTPRPSGATTALRPPAWRESTQRSAAVQPYRPVPPPWRRAAVLLGACAALALVTLAGVSWVGRTRAAPTESATTPPSAGESAPAPAPIHLAIHVSPANAQISIDGVLATSNPAEAELPKDDKAHHVTAFADGYETKSQDVAFVRDLSLDIDLERRLPPRGTVPAAPAPAAAARARAKAATDARGAAADETATPPSNADFAPATGHVPFRPIVTNNPYSSP